MGALPRPDLAPGPHRELVDALHDLHHRAGWPSLRTLAREAGVSHTTISKTFSHKALPSWGALEVLVDALDGDVAVFRELWLLASTTTNGATVAVSRIAGRQSELAAVRRHLETGGDLLLVTGEAGMGKTKLVTTAAQAADSFIAVGHCLPLSTQVPLLPVAEALRAVHESDGGAWLDDAVTGLPSWVPEALRAVLPELAATRSVSPDSGSMHHMVGAAVRLVLSALAARRPLALLLEDLHWADTSTLDLIEHLLTRPTPPMLCTWRSDDPDVSDPNTEWHNRVRRLPTVRVLRLSTMTQAETAAQLELLVGRQPDADSVRSIHARSLGLPLFTEQLAAAVSASEGTLPDLLSDLLDARLGLLSGAAWTAARALAAADRSLTSEVLAAASGLDHAELVDALHRLAARQLLSSTVDNTVMLRHPLLAEAIRRRVVPGESQAQHAALARALAASARAEPAEIAGHWSKAGNPEEELLWRVRAARAAAQRFALRNELDQWMRCLELWPGDADEAGDPPVRLVDVFVSALDLMGGLSQESAERLNRDAMTLVPHLSPLDAAEVLQRVGDFHSAFLGDHERGLELVQRAVDAYESAGPCEGQVRALGVMKFAFDRLGRDDDSAAAVARGVQVATALDHPRWQRAMLGHQASIHAKSGNRDLALRIAQEAAEVVVGPPDPRGEALLAAHTTDILLMSGADMEAVVRAGRLGLDAVEPWGIDLFVVAVIRFNMAVAMRRAGQVGRAWELLEQAVEVDALSQELLAVERALLLTLRGDVEAGAALAAQLEKSSWRGLDDRLEVEEQLAEVALWTGQPEKAFRRLMKVVEQAAPTQASRRLGPLLARAARAAADLHDLQAQGVLTTAKAACSSEPFMTKAVPIANRAWSPTWLAEVARIANEDTTDQWVVAASAWDKLARPHEAAYCRWHAAEVALREGQGTNAARLLRRAAIDAREHEPLARVIDNMT